MRIGFDIGAIYMRWRREARWAASPREWRRQSHRHANVSHHLGALRAFKPVLHQGAAHHRARGAAHSLEKPPGIQHSKAGCQGGKQGSHGQQGEAGYQHHFAAIPVRERALHQLANTLRHHARAEGQLHLRLAGAEQVAPLLHGEQAERHGGQALGQLGSRLMRSMEGVCKRDWRRYRQSLAKRRDCGDPLKMKQPRLTR